MDKKIFFDHAYSIDQNYVFIKKLSKLGFKLNPSTVHHPKTHCKFISFSHKKYLEFLHFTLPEDTYEAPGIAFGSINGLKDRKKAYLKNGVQCLWTHRNYEWKSNSIDILPGWNFLDFPKRRFRTFYPWFITYDPRPIGKNSVRKETVVHPNGVRNIIGHEFIVNDHGRAFFTSIFGTRIKDYIVLGSGEKFYFRQGQSNTYSKVILGTKDISKTMTFMKHQETVKFQDRKAVLIKNPTINKRMWDIVIVED